VAPRLSLTNVARSYGATRALSHVDLEAEKGEVHALLGENGAGKSTLLGILSGSITPDAGTMLLDGVPYVPRSPAEGRKQGIALVHQELSLCAHLTVGDNVLLGLWPSRFGIIDRTRSRKAVEAALSAVSAGEPVGFSPDDRVSALGPGERQLVEIARALALPSCRVLLLDEPTSSLGRADVARLFTLLRKLRTEGRTLLYVSHFVEEVREIADRYTVLRDGSTVASGNVADVDAPALVEKMAGRPVQALFPRSERARGEPLLDLADLAGYRLPVRASLTVHRGEVVGIAGLVGAGRTELLRAVMGLDRVRSGKLKIGALEGPVSPATRVRQGVGMLSEDRKREGLCLGMSIADNVTLSSLDRLARRGVLSPARREGASLPFLSRLRVRASSPAQRVGELSGGNQQKVALARLLCRDVDLWLLDEPTRGIDVGTRADIYELVDELARRGKAILLVSSSLPELLGACDRIAVMTRGVLGPAREVAALDETSLLLEATAT
jgi:ribose transport system ATP-binding protein